MTRDVDTAKDIRDMSGPTPVRGERRFCIGLDVGGTFTDLFMLDEMTGVTFHHKLPSTPSQPDLAPLRGIAELLKQADATGGEVVFIGLGTTVATNALLERKGAVTGLITTEGFRDLLEIARQRRPHMFDLHMAKPVPLIPRELRRDVRERITWDGTVLVPLDHKQLLEETDCLRAAGVESIAVCFLNGYANPVHEQLARKLVRERWPEAYVTISSEVLPEFREYERLSSTVVNAYLMPIMHGYFARFEKEVAALTIPVRPFVMSSGGGVVDPVQAKERPIDTLFSGPSGGVSGAMYVSALAGFQNVITFDMGGTSTEACLIKDGVPQISYSRVISGLPIRAVALDVHTVGAGGSSIAAIDAGGLLQVGPQSAGAKPGPACYGLGGDDPTVTDANVVLGRLNSEYLLGGALRIDAQRSQTAIEQKIAVRKCMSVIDAAASILAIANANMAQAVRFVSVERGIDPQDFVLVAFGGAGPLHAAFIAEELGIRGVLIPSSPGVLCALGVLTKDVQMDFSQTRLLCESDSDICERLQEIYADIESKARSAFERTIHGAVNVLTERVADVRYVGQNHELTVPVPADVLATDSLQCVKKNFDRAHEEMYGYCSPDKEFEIVTLRLRAWIPIEKRNLTNLHLPQRDGALRPVTRRPVFFNGTTGHVDCAIYERGALRPGDAFEGPAVIEQMDATTVVPPRFKVTVDAFHNLLLTPPNGARA